MSFPSHFSTFSFNGLGNRRALAGTYRGRVDLFSKVSFLRMLEQTGSSFTNAIFEKALEASITCNLLGICIVRMIPAWKHQNRGPEDSGAGLEASWTVLEASWKRLGGLLDRFEPKKEPKSIKNRFKDRSLV